MGTELDSFTHRTAVRSKLAQDKSWKENYISKALPMMDKQDNEIAYLLPWCKLEIPEKEDSFEKLSPAAVTRHQNDRACILV
ncbi:protein NipSnap homolog 3A-like [Anomaloglossus baeobatrachus]|uniref:protein NipSnap homolog 3A-like n=1 Tax=Anomaloglossus baeobatrachus TaxID=238106 RepID=UPI003F505B4B